MNEHEQRLIANISKSMAMMSSSNTIIENTHGGIEAISHTGDFSNAVVIDANVRRIPWTEVSRIGTEEMAARSERPNRGCLNVVDRSGRVHAADAPRTVHRDTSG